MDRALMYKAALLHPTEIMQPFDALLEMAGFDTMFEFAEQLDGVQIYVPSVRTIFAKCLELEVRKEFNGGNYAELAKKYGYTNRHIRRMFEK